MHADDKKVYGTHNESTIILVHQALAQSIINVIDWGKAWDISVTLYKTVTLHTGKLDNPEYYYSDAALKIVKKMRNLGILNNLDANLISTGQFNGRMRPSLRYSGTLRAPILLYILQDVCHSCFGVCKDIQRCFRGELRKSNKLSRKFHYIVANRPELPFVLSKLFILNG